MQRRQNQPQLRQAFQWIGSKYRLSPRICELMPKHGLYAEVFGGSGAVLLRKEPAPVEVFNDLNEDVINFFQVLRDRPRELIYKTWATPYSRQLFANLCKMRPPKDSVMRAWWFFTIANMSFSGTFANGKPMASNWSRSIDIRKDRPKSISKFLSKVQNLHSISERFRGVYIECLDFERLIGKWDVKEALFYCDPPYIGHASKYMGNFQAMEHERLAESLNAIKGKVILSYYQHPMLKKLYPKWRRIGLPATVTSGGRKGRACRRATELLLLNFQP